MISEELLLSGAMKSLQTALQSGKDLLIEELWDSPKAAVLALAQKTEKRILVVSSGHKEERLLDNANYFGLENVLEFPSWETLPGDEIAPSLDIMGKRLEILYQLVSNHKPCIVFTTLQGALQKTLSPKSLKQLCRHLRPKDTLDYQTIPELLQGLGYRRSAVVSDKAEYALRHGILDIFPVSATDPIRIEFFGDEIEEIRHFDPVSQKSMGKREEFFLAPASEYSLLQETHELASLADYFPASSLIVFDGLVELEDRYVALINPSSKKMTRCFSEAKPDQSDSGPNEEAIVHYGRRGRVDMAKPQQADCHLFGARVNKDKSRLLLSWQEFLNSLEGRKKLFFSEHPIEDLSEIKATPKGRQFYSGKDPLHEVRFEVADTFFSAERFRHPFCPLAEFFSSVENRAAASAEELLHGLYRMRSEPLHLRLVFANDAEENNLKARLEESCPQLPKKTTFEKGYLSSGFVLVDSLFVLLPMPELTHRYKVRRQKWRNTYHTPASEFHTLETGDIVVHFHHGIGKYLGLEKRPNHLGQPTEFLIIEYAEGGKLYVPIQQAYLVSRYIGAHEEIPSLHAIGGKQWLRTRAQAEKAIVGYAQDLLHLQAQRVSLGGFAFEPDNLDMKSFEEEFPYAETDDQLRAIDDVKKDMQQLAAMDRLICGDVGYGKTEVAMRAAFKAVACGGKQVAVLVPTTVLAMQHYDNFKTRMANFPISIASISRFQKPKQISKILKDTADGKVDILIGTHRLISKDVKFANLGLIVIDEEQRFGVRAKEHLKALKTGVDCLTLSATPIPRTLYMSLIGARTISVINTPPHDRLPIKSLIAERDPALIHNALLRELSRDGQAFFIHNRVESIFQVQKELHELLPEAKIVVAHGQMSPDEIDTVFHTFKNGHADILVATTIVENGIDIPNANTILIDRADRFGLADLYQMRGRVGRWNRPAYAYFLTPRNRSLNDLSRKRLFALAEGSGYGGGMKIAMRDLEIRGAGDILGTQQSGHIATIGFHLYCKLLKRAIDAMQKKVLPDFREAKMEFSFDARLPEDYIAETNLRMEIYHRFGDARTFDEIDSLLQELKDRFGPIPEQVLWLAALTQIKIAASQKGYTFLKFDRMTLTAERETKGQPARNTFPLPRATNPQRLREEVLKILDSTPTR